MTKSRNHPRTSAGRRAGQRQFPWLAVIVALAVLAAGVLALLIPGSDDSDADDAPGMTGELTLPTIEGAALPRLSGTEADQGLGVGQQAPVVHGVGIDDEETVVPQSGRPAILLFLAHWCPHCRAEVPVVQEWLSAGRLPADVDLVGVLSHIDPARPNYPPSAWLDREGWSAATVFDPQSQAAAAYGLHSFPLWVAVDADGRVITRYTGRLSSDQLDALVATARRPAED
jgi:cytochrome c biogenesis protein CcmG, thiol:disulfide interchange protein DsbE